MTDIASLAVEVRSGDVVRARNELDKLTAAGGAAGGMAKSLATSFRSTALGAAAVVAAAAGAAFAVDRLVKSVGGYQDIAERTGGSAEGFASIRTAADVAGVSVDSVAEAANRLTRNLSKVNEESDEAQRALRSIGLSAAELRNQSPDEQLRTVAQALAKYEDNANKAAIAQALYGRGGAALLPVLKELGQEQQRVTLLTRSQIEAADEYADAQARARSQLVQLAEVAAVQAAPALNALLRSVNQVATEIVGLSAETNGLARNDGIADFAKSGVQAFGVVVSAGQVVSRTLEGIGVNLGGLAAAASAVVRGEFAQARAILAEMDAANAEIAQREFFVTRLQRQLDVLNGPQADYSNEGRNRRRRIDFQAPPKTPKRGGKSADGLRALKIESEQEAAIFQSRNAALQAYYSATLIGEAEFLAGRQAARNEYIVSLQAQFAQEKALLEAQARSGPADKRADAQNALTKATADYNEKLRALAESGAAEEIERIGKAKMLAFEATQKAGKAEADNLTQLAEGNQALRDEIALLGATEEAKAAIEKARIRSIRTLKEERLAQLEANGVHESQLRALQLEIDLLREREELIDVRSQTSQAVDARQKDEELTRRLGEDMHREVRDALSAAFRDTENPARAFAEGLANILYTRVSARLADAMADALVGKDGTSGLLGDIFGSILGSFVGAPGGDSIIPGGVPLPDILRGGRASGGPTQRGLYEVNERGPELYREGGKTYLMSGGGMVTPARQMPGQPSGETKFNVKVNVIGGPEPEVRTRRNGNQIDIDLVYRQIVNRLSADTQQGGGLDPIMSGRYGLNPGANGRL